MPYSRYETGKGRHHEDQEKIVQCPVALEACEKDDGEESAVEKERQASQGKVASDSCGRLEWSGTACVHRECRNKRGKGLIGRRREDKGGRSCRPLLWKASREGTDPVRRRIDNPASAGTRGKLKHTQRRDGPLMIPARPLVRK